MEENKGKDQAIDIMLQNAQEYFRTGVSKSFSYRRQQLGNLARGLKEMEPEILTALKMDLRRSEYLSKMIEFDHVYNEVCHVYDNFQTWAKAEKVPTPMFLTPGCSSVQYEPLGVALIMSAWNYPMMGSLSVLANAIGAGNMAIIKPSELAKSSSRIVKKLVENYLDQKAYKVIEGAVEVSKDIITKPFDLIVFTGSPEKGKLVAAAAAENLTPCILELGGKCPCIVDSSAGLSYAASKIVDTRFMNAGQTCVAPDYVLVHEEVADVFKNKVVNQLKHTFSGRSEKYLDSDKGAIVNSDHLERIKGYLTANHGGNVLTGVKKDDELKDLKNNWIPPTIIDNPNLESAIMTDEIFGPILPIITYNDIEEAIKFINDRPKPLAIYYFGSNLSSNACKIKKETSSGAFVHNDAAFQAIHPYLPFGGVGNSGYGNYHGIYGFKAMSNAKACLTRLPLNFYPFNASSAPFTGLKQFTTKMFLKYGKIGQKQLIKRIIQILILVWLIKGFATGTFQKKWRQYKPMIMLVWGMVKPKFLR